MNKAKVDVGSSPPLDLVSAQAEVASNQEQLIIAETAVKQAEDRLRVLIYDPTVRDNWTIRIEPIDSPPVGNASLDVDAAVTTALETRADLQRVRKDIVNADTAVKYAGNQRLPDVRFNASYQASGLGGADCARAAFRNDRGTGCGHRFRLGGRTAVRARLPDLGGQHQRHVSDWWRREQANYARTKLERTQSGERLKSAEAKAIQQIRDAAWKIEMNGKRIETTRAARELAEQRLDAERKRFEVGMSTSFLVIQAQRDMAQAKTNELGAVLSYDLSLVDYEALQQAGPAGQSSAGSQGSGGSQSSGAVSVAPALPACGSERSVIGLPGVPQGQ